MSTIKTIIISALTYYFLSFLGIFVIIPLLLGIWAYIGYLSYKIEERYDIHHLSEEEDKILHMVLGAFALLVTVGNYRDFIIFELREIKNRAFPKE